MMGGGGERGREIQRERQSNFFFIETVRACLTFRLCFGISEPKPVVPGQRDTKC
jgi:hypothetical protein